MREWSCHSALYVDIKYPYSCAICTVKSRLLSLYGFMLFDTCLTLLVVEHRRRCHRQSEACLVSPFDTHLMEMRNPLGEQVKFILWLQ